MSESVVRTPYALLLFLYLVLLPSAVLLSAVPDSLTRRLADVPPSKERVDLLNDIAWQIRHNAPDDALEYALRAEHLADSLDYRIGRAWAFRNRGVAHYIKGNYADAMTLNIEALRIFKAEEFDEGIASTYINIGLIQWQTGNLDDALQYFLDALPLARSQRITATANANLGLVYTNRAEYDEALRYTRISLDHYREMQDSLGISRSLNNIGWIYELQLEFDKALREYRHSLAIREKLGDMRRIASVCISIGSVLSEKEHYRSALAYLQRAHSLGRSIGERKLVEEAYAEMSEVYADMGAFEEAYLYKTRYVAIKDSLMDQQISNDIAKLKADFALEQAEQEVELLKRTNQLQETIAYATSGGLLLVLVFSIISFFGYRSKVRINRQLQATQKQLIVQEKLASLGQLTAGIAHEIQNPLNFINNFSAVSGELIEELQDDTLDPEEHRQILDDLKQSVAKINEHGSRADAIVRGMMTHARSSSEDARITDVNALLGYVVDLASHGTNALQCAKKLEFRKEFEASLPSINVVPQDLSQVFLNIMNNAIDAMSERCLRDDDESFSPTIVISTVVEGSNIVVRIRDNGMGMPESVRNRIFEPFFTTKETGKGTGLGLSISYDIIVQKYGGTMNVHSREFEYTEFEIMLSVNL